MISFVENCRSHHAYLRRTNGAGQMGRRAKLSAASGSACSNHSKGGRWNPEPGHRSDAEDFATNRATLASTLFGTSVAGTRKGCSPSRTHSAHFASQSAGGNPGHPAQDARQRDPLERTEHGRSPRPEQRHDSSYLEAPQSEAPFDRNLQAQSRQTIRRETPRRRGVVSQSSRQGPGALCGRKEPDSSLSYLCAREFPLARRTITNATGPQPSSPH